MTAADAYAQFIALISAALAAQSTNAIVGVLHVHAQRIRQVRTLFGFEFGDRLLAAIAERLRAALRPGGKMLHVEAGDFLVLLPELLGPRHGLMAAERIQREFEQPVAVDCESLVVPIAIGAAFAPQHGETADLLARRAAAAVDRALGRCEPYATAESGEDDPMLLDELRRALTANALTVHFEPVVSVIDDRLVGLEALARWSHPVRGMVAPSWFLPLAEQAGLAPELTRWSLHAAMREFAKLHRLRPDLRCAVNLSSRVFGDPALPEQVTAALAIWGVPPDRLVLEVTETALIEDPVRSAEALRRLRTAGIGIALDDFGRGYSSFQYLKHLPATELKIDRVFVQVEPGDSRAVRLLSAMVELARGLELPVVAEGVELAEQAALVRDLGCQYAHGWHYGRPQSIEAWIDTLTRSS